MKIAILLLLAVVANGLDGDVVLLQRGTGESFTVHDLSAQHDQEALQDQVHTISHTTAFCAHHCVLG